RLGPPSAWWQAAVFVGLAAAIAILPTGILIRRLDATRRERDAARLGKAEAEQLLAEQVAALERERAKRAEPGPPASSAAGGFKPPGEAQGRGLPFRGDGRGNPGGGRRDLPRPGVRGGLGVPPLCGGAGDGGRPRRVAAGRHPLRVTRHRRRERRCAAARGWR